MWVKHQPSVYLRRNKQWDVLLTFPLTFYFKLAMDSEEVAKNNTEKSHVLFTQLSPAPCNILCNSSPLTNPEIGIIQLGRLQISFRISPVFKNESFSIFVVLRNLYLCRDSCNLHHKQDTELFYHQKELLHTALL